MTMDQDNKSTDRAALAAKFIMDDLRGRSGVLDGIDFDIVDEIEADIRGIIEGVYMLDSGEASTTDTIVDRIEAALDSSALLTICTVFKAGTDHFVQNPTRDGALDYLNMLESVCICVNRGLVGQFTQDEVESRVEFEVGLIEKNFPGLMDEATMKPSDLCEIRSVIGNARRKREIAAKRLEWWREGEPA